MNSNSSVRISVAFGNDLDSRRNVSDLDSLKRMFHIEIKSLNVAVWLTWATFGYQVLKAWKAFHRTSFFNFYS